MLEWFGLETIAVILGIAYLLFAMRENSLCWYCAFISTGIYIWIFRDVSLYMESALNAYYMVMAVYGWYQWQRGGNNAEGIKLNCWTLKNHVVAIGLILFYRRYRAICYRKILRPECLILIPLLPGVVLLLPLWWRARYLRIGFTGL